MTIGAGAFNPPPGGANGSQQQINDTTQPSQRVWLWWEEPGTWEEPGLTNPNGIFYLIVTEGLTPDQVVQIASNLTPVALARTP